MKKRIEYKGSIFIVEKVSKYYKCGLIDGQFDCPFYQPVNEGLMIIKSIKNVHTERNLERHNCFLLKDLIYGTENADKLWKMCPGEII